MNDIIICISQYLLWPIIIPIIVSLITYLFSIIYMNKEDIELSNLSKEDSKKYINLSKNKKIFNLYNNFAYFYLTNSIWGISRLTGVISKSDLYNSFFSIYIILLLWSIIIIIHSILFRNNKIIIAHYIFAFIIFIFTRTILFISLNL